MEQREIDAIAILSAVIGHIGVINANAATMRQCAEQIETASDGVLKNIITLRKILLEPEKYDGLLPNNPTE